MIKKRAIPTPTIAVVGVESNPTAVPVNAGNANTDTAASSSTNTAQGTASTDSAQSTATQTNSQKATNTQTAGQVCFFGEVPLKE